MKASNPSACSTFGWYRAANKKKHRERKTCERDKQDIMANEHVPMSVSHPLHPRIGTELNHALNAVFGTPFH